MTPLLDSLLWFLACCAIAAVMVAMGCRQVKARGE